MQYKPSSYDHLSVGKVGIVGASGAIETRIFLYGSFSSTVGTLVQPVETIKTASSVTRLGSLDLLGLRFVLDCGDFLLCFMDLL